MRLPAIPALAFVACLAAGCAGMSPPPGLSKQQLENAKYRLAYNGGEPFVLKDGRNDKVPTRSADTTLRVAMAENVAFGDLNADGLQDAVVVLASNLGGTGTYMTLAAVENDNGQPYHTANVDLGDRTEVKALRVEGNLVTVDVVRVGPNDPACCPTEKATLRFRYEQPGGKGTDWYLVPQK
jgi:hypothetical protein